MVAIAGALLTWRYTTHVESTEAGSYETRNSDYVSSARRMDAGVRRIPREQLRSRVAQLTPDAATVAEVTIRPGNDAVLRVQGAALEIPADAIEAGTVVTLSVDAVDETDFPSQFLERSEPLSHVFTLTWSTTQKARFPQRLAIDVAPYEGIAFARYSVRGNLASFSHKEPRWARLFVDVLGGSEPYVELELVDTSAEYRLVILGAVPR